ncbi:MAG: rhomboid family intramembrane serine protease [Microbacteriaceae bacterium]|jgi:membrane associated rhomboid family serine protease
MRIPGTATPVVTYALIGFTFVVFALQWIPGLAVTENFLYAPVFTWGDNGLGVPYEPWRMLTSVFLHSTGFFLHIVLNMYTLFIFGQVLETMLGRGRFLALYLISGFGGSVAVMYLASPQTGVVGASGAIFGLLGAFIVIQRKLGGDYTQLLVLLGINLVIGFLPGMSISWQAHVGGLVTGILVGLIFANTRRRKQAALQVILTCGLALGLVALVAVQAPGLTR